MSKPGSKRLFFALWPDDGVRASLVEAARKIRENADGRIVPDANLHITLAFLGTVGPDKVDGVATAADSVAAEHFTLTMDRPGWWRRTGILWIAPSESPIQLNRLVKAIWAELEPLGFWPDFRDFRPHLTIGRKCRRARIPDIEPITWPVTEFALLESETHHRGARYSVMKRWPLNSALPAENGGCRDARSVE